MKADFDAIVIGSGFGGSVMSCRLTEKGYKVCLLERGQEWKMNSFPRRIQEIKNHLPWSPQDKKFGFMEIRDYPESDVMSVSGAGLGGGSLIYANVMIRMPEDFFAGWPGTLNRKMLDPFYDKVEQTLEASPYPLEKDIFYKNTTKTHALRKVAEGLSVATENGATGKPEFILPFLAIRFKGDFPGHQTLNGHGALQSKCTKCGECDIGCNIHAKNTLDLNYLFKARNIKNGRTPLEVRTHAEVREIKDISTATEARYEVTYVDPRNPDKVQTITASKVVLSAGSIHSTELLLKMRASGRLKNLSPALGSKWCGNGDLEGMVFNTKNFVEPSDGPVITGAIHYKYAPYPDGFAHGMFIQDAGVPVGLDWYLSGKLVSPKTLWQYLKLVWHFAVDELVRILKLKLSKNVKINIGYQMLKAIDRNEFDRRIFILLGMGRDRNTGNISLNERGEPLINWNIGPSQLHYDRATFEMRRIAEALGGEFVENPLSAIKKIVAVHPLGGCPMGESAQEGVVNSRGEVYGHSGLYVVDASILPTSVGPNPSMTIAALAEFIADQIPEL